MLAKAVANATQRSTTIGIYFTVADKLLPMSGVILADTQPMVVAAVSPFLITIVVVNEVKAYEE